jgi:hypothetical protein
MATPRRTLIALAIAIAVAATTAAIAVGGGAAGPPKKAFVRSHGLRAATVVGSYCSAAGNETGRGVAGCGDSKYPLHPKAFLPITPNSSVRVNLRKSTKSVQADFIRGLDAHFEVVGPQLAAKPVPGTHRRVWRLRMPDDLRDADAVAMFVNFADGGDADFWAGVEPVSRWP